MLHTVLWQVNHQMYAFVRRIYIPNIWSCTAYIYTVPANPKNDAYMEMTGGQFKLKVSVLDG